MEIIQWLKSLIKRKNRKINISDLVDPKLGREFHDAAEKFNRKMEDIHNSTEVKIISVDDNYERILLAYAKLYRHAKNEKLIDEAFKAFIDSYHAPIMVPKN